MNTEHRYQLESPKLTGRRQEKTTCPRCGRGKCFVRYVDTYNGYSYLNNCVGRCDHEQSCGYHYRPSDYFHDHPWLSENDVKQFKVLPPPPHPKPFQPLPIEYVLRSRSTGSIFWQWFATECAMMLGLNPDTLKRIREDYLIGATRKGNVIFWQIDHNGMVHGGHIMQYSTNGHRNGFQGWTHIPLIQQGLLPPDWHLCQCFFGQHLLPQRPEAHVCIVESEKTALVMAAYRPEYLWLATCGSSGLNAEKLECLRGRLFTLFPDSGCLEKWQKVMQHTQGLQYTVSEEMEKYPANTDLADLLLTPLPPP